jgi:hypothetical protein
VLPPYIICVYPVYMSCRNCCMVHLAVAVSSHQVPTAHTAPAAGSPAGTPQVLGRRLTVHPWQGTRQQQQRWQQQAQQEL